MSNWSSASIGARPQREPPQEQPPAKNLEAAQIGSPRSTHPKPHPYRRTAPTDDHHHRTAPGTVRPGSDHYRRLTTDTGTDRPIISGFGVRVPGGAPVTPVLTCAFAYFKILDLSIVDACVLIACSVVGTGS